MVVIPATDVTQSLMDSARVGLDYIVENADYVEKLSSALASKNYVIRKQVFELLAALSVYNTDGFRRTLQALEHFKNQAKERYRFKFIVNELRNAPTVEYQTAVLAFINCLILATPDLRERMRVRSEFIGLRLLNVLGDLRHRNKDYPDLVVQLDVFDEQRESDESQGSPTSCGVDLSSPQEIFDAIMRLIADTPQEIPFLCILQHLLRIDPREPISDLIWDAAERLVHRATLLESPDDALGLLKVPSHSKSLHKLKESAPPPPPIPHSGPIPPPPPPLEPLRSPGIIPGAPSLPDLISQKPYESSMHKQPKLLPSSIPIPKTKMRTVNWNKIPSGQILDGDNMWSTLAKTHSKSKVELDWAALEGLFCIKNERSSLSPINIISGQSRSGELDRRNSKRDEIIVLDAKRSLNINIFLKQFRSSNDDMMQLILNGSSEEFGTERLRGLLKILPSKDEIDMLESVPVSDRSRLGTVEKFLSQLIQVAGYRLRIEAMLLKEEQEFSCRAVELSINSILQAAGDVKTSQELQEVIFMILVAGNFLNSGCYAGEALGIKLTSIQKISEIRGNKPGINLLNFVASQAEAKNPRLISFVDDMVVLLEDASKTSMDFLNTEITSLKSKVSNISHQMENPSVPRDIINQFGHIFKEAGLRIDRLQGQLPKLEEVRVDLARFFCEDVNTFKLEDCFKILHTFTTRWKLAAVENSRRKQHEKEVELRRIARDEQFKKRNPILWQNQHSVDDNKGMTLTHGDDTILHCSPRIVKRRIDTVADNNGQTNGFASNGQLSVPSPETTPNGSLRRRRTRTPSEEVESGQGLLDFLKSSCGDGSSKEKRCPNEQYGSLDRSWSRKTRRRPNLMDFVNDERERPVSPASGHYDFNIPSKTIISSDKPNLDPTLDSPTRDWRKRNAAWFVDLEDGGSGEIPKKQPPPRRFQRSFGLDSRRSNGTSSRGLATLPEGDIGQEQDNMALIKLKTDVVSTMEAIEEIQSPTRNKPLWARPSYTTNENLENKEFPTEGISSENSAESSRRTLIGNLGLKDSEDKLVLYIAPPVSPKTKHSLPESEGKPERTTNFLNRSVSPNAGTKEGFERFASIRRSRRIKRPDFSSATASSSFRRSSIANIPQPKYVSKVDIRADSLTLIENPSVRNLHTGNNIGKQSVDLRAPEPRTRRSEILGPDQSEHLSGHLANHDSKSDRKNNRSTDASVSKYSTSHTNESKYEMKAKPGMTYSNGTSERDEGFEESQSSLSETNSQADPNIMNGFHGSIGSRLRNSFRESRTPPSASNLSMKTGANPPSGQNMRRTSFQENSPLDMITHANNKSNSKTSLQSSRTSLTSSQATVKESNDSKLKKLAKNVDYPSNNKRRWSTSDKSNGLISKRHIMNSNNSNKDLLNLSQTKLDSTEKVRQTPKGLAPRLLSFMRPTASSAAKDKLDTVKLKGNSNSMKKAFK